MRVFSIFKVDKFLSLADLKIIVKEENLTLTFRQNVIILLTLILETKYILQTKANQRQAITLVLSKAWNHRAVNRAPGR